MSEVVKLKPTKEDYNVVFKAIKESLITTTEFNSLTIPEDWEEKDLLLNVRNILIERGLIGNELKKLALYDCTKGIDLRKDITKPKPNSNVFIGGSL